MRDLIRGNGAVTGVKAVDKSGETREFHAPITIDASGRDAFSVTRNGWKMRDPYLNKIAVWTYYKGAMRDPGVDEGATTVAYVPEKGWFWYIPLAGDIVSVGVVAEKDYLTKTPRIWRDLSSRSGKERWIKEHLAVGEQFGPYRITGEYSYRSQLLRGGRTGTGGRCVRISRSGVLLRRVSRAAQRRAGRRCRRRRAHRRRFFGGAILLATETSCAEASNPCAAGICVLRSRIQLPRIPARVPPSERRSDRLPDRQSVSRFRSADEGPGATSPKCRNRSRTASR